MSEFVDILRDVLETVEVERDKIEGKSGFMADPEAIAYQNGRFKGFKEAEKVVKTAIEMLVFVEDVRDLIKKCYTFFAGNRIIALMLSARIEGTKSKEIIEQLQFEGEVTAYLFVLNTIDNVEKGE